MKAPISPISALLVAIVLPLVIWGKFKVWRIAHPQAPTWTYFFH